MRASVPEANPDPHAAQAAALLGARGERLRVLARRLLGSEADDGMQEVFAATCRSLPGFRGEAKLTTWFHRLALRVLCAYRRRREVRSERENAVAEPEAQLSLAALRAHADCPLEQLAVAERRARVQQALARLSPPLREVLLLRGEGLDYRAIADTLAIPLGTVKSRIAAAMVALAERLPTAEELL